MVQGFVRNDKKREGVVYLVGAGPGDIGLLTVKGLRCLQKAEVVIYDFHLNAQILNYINHTAEFSRLRRLAGARVQSSEYKKTNMEA